MLACSQRQRGLGGEGWRGEGWCRGGGGTEGGAAPPSGREDRTSQTEETTTVAVPSLEQTIISVRSYHLFNINEIFNEVPNCRLISPSLISTGEI